MENMQASTLFSCISGLHLVLPILRYLEYFFKGSRFPQGFKPNRDDTIPFCTFQFQLRIEFYRY